MNERELTKAQAANAKTMTRKLSELPKEERDELRASLDSLEAAAGCPAAGVRVKKGTFDAHAA